MKKVSQTRQFSRDIKRMWKRGKNLRKLQEVVKLLAEGAPLQESHRDHPLIGPWQPSRDCHIEADWILIYTADKDSLRLERTGAQRPFQEIKLSTTSDRLGVLHILPCS